MTEQELAKIEARAAKRLVDAKQDGCACDGEGTIPTPITDAECYEHFPAAFDTPALVAEVRRLQRELRSAKAEFGEEERWIIGRYRFDPSNRLP